MKKSEPQWDEAHKEDQIVPKPVANRSRRPTEPLSVELDFLRVIRVFRGSPRPSLPLKPASGGRILPVHRPFGFSTQVPMRWLMVAFRGVAEVEVAFFVALAVAGCAGDTDVSKVPASPIQTAPALSGTGAGKPKTAELPDLPRGAGQMDANVPDELTRTRSGLYYRILRKGEGKKPRPTDTVVVNYKGWLDNGREFDSSYGKGQPLVHPLNQLVPGWIEGIPLIGEGGMIELEIPPDLAYGPRGQGAVPPNATLHFIVELLEVK